MDVTKILTELRKQREQIDEAILSLEALAKGKRRLFRKPPDDPDRGSGGTPGEGCAGVPNPLLPRRPRRGLMVSLVPLPEQSLGTHSLEADCSARFSPRFFRELASPGGFEPPLPP